MKFKGQLEGFPEDIVRKMLERQVAQGNKVDVTVFEKAKDSNYSRKGFNWTETPEGHSFWKSVIIDLDFNLFFHMYPKTSPYPKIMMVWDKDPKNKVPRVVFMEKQGKFLAWNSAETFEEAEQTYLVSRWNHAEDIIPENSEKKELLKKAEELIAKAEELKKAAEKL